MGYKCTFMDNEVYSADEVNQMLARLTSQGVSLYNDTGNPLADLNTAVCNLTGEGVTLDGDSCKVVKDGNMYKVSQGTAIMADGSMITFDVEGYELNVKTGVVQHVYLSRNVATNTIDVIVTESEPTDDVLFIAKISENGNILDMRKFARAKIGLASANQIQYATINGTNSGKTTGWVLIDSVELLTGFNYVLIKSDSSSTDPVLKIAHGADASVLTSEFITIDRYAGRHVGFVQSGNTLNVYTRYDKKESYSIKWDITLV